MIEFEYLLVELGKLFLEEYIVGGDYKVVIIVMGELIVYVG